MNNAIITKFVNAELGYEVQVAQVPNPTTPSFTRYSVTIFDTDAQEVFPAHEIHLSLGKAIESAQAIAGTNAVEVPA